MDTKGKASSTVSWVLFGLIKPSNVQLKETCIMKLNCTFRLLIFPLRSPGELYNQENVTVTPLELLGWRHVMLTYISDEGMTCVESTDFNKIWPENSLNIKQ